MKETRKLYNKYYRINEIIMLILRDRKTTCELLKEIDYIIKELKITKDDYMLSQLYTCLSDLMSDIFDISISENKEDNSFCDLLKLLISRKEKFLTQDIVNSFYYKLMYFKENKIESPVILMEKFFKSYYDKYTYDNFFEKRFKNLFHLPTFMHIYGTKPNEVCYRNDGKCIDTIRSSLIDDFYCHTCGWTSANEK